MKVLKRFLKKLVYLFRVAEDSKTENAGALAFVTENERTTSKDADSTQTKDGNVRTPYAAEIEITSTSLLPKGDKMIDKLESAMLNDKLVECWEVNLANLALAQIVVNINQNIIKDILLN